MIVALIIMIILMYLIYHKIEYNSEQFKTYIDYSAYPQASHYLDGKYHKYPYNFYELYGDLDNNEKKPLLDGGPEWERIISRRNHIPTEEEEFKFIS